MENIDFDFMTLLVITSKLLHPPKLNWKVWVSWNNSDQTWMTVGPDMLLTFEKMHKICENKGLGYLSP